MDTQTLARWNESCASIKGGPFPHATVFVTKATNSATVVFWAKPGIGTAILSGIGGDTANYQQIAAAILTVASQHGLLDAETKVSTFEGRLV